MSAISYLFRTVKKGRTLLILQLNGLQVVSLLVGKLIGNEAALKIDYFFIRQAYRKKILPWLGFLYVAETLKNGRHICFESSNISLLRVAKKYIELEPIETRKDLERLLEDLEIKNNEIDITYNIHSRLHVMRFKLLPPPEQFYFVWGLLDWGKIENSVLYKKLHSTYVNNKTKIIASQFGKNVT